MIVAAGLQLSGVVTLKALDDQIGGRSLLAYVDQMLLPELEPYDVGFWKIPDAKRASAYARQIG